MERSRAKHLFVSKSSNISLVIRTEAPSDSAGIVALLSDGIRVILQLGGGLLDSLTKEVCMIIIPSTIPDSKYYEISTSTLLPSSNTFSDMSRVSSEACISCQFLGLTTFSPTRIASTKAVISHCLKLLKFRSFIYKHIYTHIDILTSCLNDQALICLIHFLRGVCHLCIFATFLRVI